MGKHNLLILNNVAEHGSRQAQVINVKILAKKVTLVRARAN